MTTYLPRIKIIATGGTIAGKAPSSTATTGYQSGVLDINDIMRSIPDLHSIANLEYEQFFNIDSVDMTIRQIIEIK